MVLSDAERAARYRERRKASDKPAVVRYRRPADRRSKAKQWDDAVDTLLTILDRYQEWRDNMPAGVSDSATAQRLDDVLALRDLVEQLQGVDLPQGFGRDWHPLVNWKGYNLQHKPTTQQSGEFSTGTSGEISTGIDKHQ
jgi:hypothetical protein